MFITWLCIVLCALLILEWFMNRRTRAKIFWNIPGPPGRFIFGNGLLGITTPDKLFQNIRKFANTYSDLYRLWIYPYGYINIYNPQDIEVIISSSKYNEKSIIYNFLSPWLRDGLLLSKGIKWQNRRKILTPAFHFNILQKFSTIMEENSWKLVEKLEAREQEQILDVKTLTSDITLNLICETSMGIKFEEDLSEGSKAYKNAIKEIGKLIVYRAARIWLYLDTIFFLTEIGQRQKEVLKVIHNFPKKIMDNRRKYVEKHGVRMPFTDLEDDFMMRPLKRKMAMLDLLLSAEKEGLIHEKGIQEEVDTFMFEGHDTTASGLTFALLELANNKNIQERVVQELKGIFRESSRVATIQDFNNMVYLECCIKETLRLYPPVPFISRKIEDGVTLSGFEIPPGTNNICNIHIFDLHRREDLFPDALTYDPERFFPGSSSSRHPFAYIPFSGGQRNCIGQRFAMLQMKSVLSSILRRFELQPITKPSELKFTVDLLLKTTHPIYVNFVRRF